VGIFEFEVIHRPRDQAAITCGKGDDGKGHIFRIDSRLQVLGLPLCNSKITGEIRPSFDETEMCKFCYHASIQWAKGGSGEVPH
jgi:hypothetical protein